MTYAAQCFNEETYTQYFVYICISSLRSRERFDAVGLIVKSTVVNTLYSPHPPPPVCQPSQQVPLFQKLHQRVDIGPVTSTIFSISSQIIVPSTERMSSLKMLPTPHHSPCAQRERREGGRCSFCTGVAAAFVHNSFLCEHAQC